jgi:3',5'-nucleoside bisphosphate phosphatase
MIDLHIHTNMSDGTLSPEEVVRLAARAGLKAIAITDHDTVKGVAPAQEEGERWGVEVIPGVEISVFRKQGILHILGYFVDTSHKPLLKTLEYLQQCRLNRIPQILEKLASLNVNIDPEEIAPHCLSQALGRPHVASIMVQRGYVSTIQEAFDNFLRRGAPAYVEKSKLSPRDAVEAILNSGGLPVVAHPYSLGNLNAVYLERTIQELISYGLVGIEAYYPSHTVEQTELYLELAGKLGLIVTGGTDFHGSNKPEVEIGIFPGRPPLPYRLVEKLKLRRNS